MPNTLDSTGLTIKTLPELIADLTAALKVIYGTGINVASNSPDGQLINILSQAIYDNLSLLLDVYNSFDVESASGVALDRLVPLNGLIRGAATYTVAPVEITVDKALTLIGKDALVATPTAIVFTVQDDTGNQFQLATTKVFGAAGTSSLVFNASDPGVVEVAANTITQQTTVISGVTLVNNPTVTGVVVGVNEETDSQLKMRRAKMYKLASIGPADSVQAALLAPWFSNVGASDALVIENDTAAPVGGVPANSLYCIVRDNGLTAHRFIIPKQIMSKKAPGCGLHGAESEVATRSNGIPYTGKWDWAVAQPLYITFGITPKTTGVTFDSAVVAAELAASLSYLLGQSPTIGDVVVAMNTLFPQAIVTGCGVSATAGSYTDTVAPTALKNYYTVDAANIVIT